jgi:hypothetical protein
MAQNHKQTALEWLIEKINSHDSHDAVILSAKYFNESKLLKYLQVAKEMEKKQIIDAVDYGCSDYGSQKDGEEYYHQNYGKE